MESFLYSTFKTNNNFSLQRNSGQNVRYSREPESAIRAAAEGNTNQQRSQVLTNWIGLHVSVLLPSYRNNCDSTKFKWRTIMVSG